MAAKHKIVIIIIAIVFLVIAAISCQWYKQNVYPYKYVEEWYTQNQEHFADITAYFKSFNTADIRTASMKNNGQVEITSYTQPMQRFSAVSESGYQSLTALRELCIKNDDNEFGEQNYILNTINAVYDESGNMMLEIPLYAKGDENSPNRIVWYLIYCDDEYKLDSIISSVKNKNPINDNCFICSKSHSLS